MSIYVVTGSDEGRVAEEAAALFEELKPPGSDEFANEIIEAVADNAENAFQKLSQAVEALQTIGFFGGDKVVWLKSANFLGTDRTSEAERTLAGAENLLETLQASGSKPTLNSNHSIKSMSPKKAGKNRSPFRSAASPETKP
mgnify:CR=1 FL=1